jgi:2-methylcitrate dehydratase PrpD
MALSATSMQAAEGGSASAPFPHTSGLTRQVAEFIVRASFNDLTAELLEVGKKSLLDSIGVAICGSVADTGRIGRDYIQSLGISRGDATVIGTNMKAPPRFAAFLNAIGIHADDYDDTQLAVAPDRTYGLLTHPSTTAFSSALATAEAGGRSGRDFMLAYHVGVEVECKLAEASSPRHYEDGFHSTGTFGTIGAGAAAAKIERLDVDKVLRALGIAASSAAGVRENFGTMTKPLHAGRAAESGIVAADLAGRGWTATDQVLEAERGFYRAAAGTYDPNAILGKLGKPWTFLSPGVSIKPHPSGSLTHPGMTEMLRLIREYDIKPGNVESVDVGTNHVMPTALIHHQPKNHLQAKFSMEFCMASLLLYRRAGLMEFNDEVVNRPEVQSMIGRVHFRVNEEAEKAGFNKMTTIIAVHMKDGQVIRGRADFAKGSPQIPMSYDEVAAKFQDCAAFAKWPRAKADAIVAAVRKLEDMADVRTLTALCAA